MSNKNQVIYYRFNKFVSSSLLHKLLLSWILGFRAKTQKINLLSLSVCLVSTRSHWSRTKEKNINMSKGVTITKTNSIGRATEHRPQTPSFLPVLHNDTGEGSVMAGGACPSRVRQTSIWSTQTAVVLRASVRAYAGAVSRGFRVSVWPRGTGVGRLSSQIVEAIMLTDVMEDQTTAWFRPGRSSSKSLIQMLQGALNVKI